LKYKREEGFLLRTVGAYMNNMNAIALRWCTYVVRCMALIMAAAAV